MFILVQNSVAYQKAASLDHQKWLKSNACRREKERREKGNGLRTPPQVAHTNCLDLQKSCVRIPDTIYAYLVSCYIPASKKAYLVLSCLRICFYLQMYNFQHISRVSDTGCTVKKLTTFQIFFQIFWQKLRQSQISKWAHYWMANLISDRFLATFGLETYINMLYLGINQF